MTVKPGDWVLVDHPMFAGSFVVREVKSVSASMFVGLAPRPRVGIDGESRSEDRRALKAIRGTFQTKDAALRAADAIWPLYEQKMAAEKAARDHLQSSVLAMLKD